jgi:viroplasmin and RNaseH domain-containing protein
MFHGRKSRVYDSWRVYSEYVVGFSDAAFQSYSTRMQAEEAYVAFFDHQNKLQKLKQVTQKTEDVAKKWSCKN